MSKEMCALRKKWMATAFWAPRNVPRWVKGKLLPTYARESARRRRQMGKSVDG